MSGTPVLVSHPDSSPSPSSSPPGLTQSLGVLCSVCGASETAGPLVCEACTAPPIKAQRGKLSAARAALSSVKASVARRVAAPPPDADDSVPAWLYDRVVLSSSDVKRAKERLEQSECRDALECAGVVTRAFALTPLGVAPCRHAT